MIERTLGPGGAACIKRIFVKPSVKINPAIKVGVNASYSFIDFTNINRSNGDGILAGPRN